MPAQPKSNAAELANRLNRLVSSGEQDSLEVKRIAREAEGLIPKDAAKAYQLLGMIASLEGNEGRMRDNFERAHRLNPTDSEIILNYATALALLALDTEARYWTGKAHELAPTNISILDRLIHETVRCGGFTEAVNLLNQRAQLNPDQPHPEEHALRKCAQFVTTSGIGDEAPGRYLQLASRLVHQSSRLVPNVEIRLAADEEAQWLSGRLHIQADLDDVMQLNEALADAVAESDLPEELTSNFTLMFVPASGDGDHAA